MQCIQKKNLQLKDCMMITEKCLNLIPVLCIAKKKIQVLAMGMCDLLLSSLVISTYILVLKTDLQI